MKHALFLAATAMLITSFNPILITPAFADATDDAQAVCDALLQPNNPNSEFFTYPGNLVEGTWVTVGDPVLGDPIGDPYGVGTPVASNVFLSNSYFRNGGSPNVWALAEATLTYPQTGQLFETLLNQTRTDTFDCVVEKFVGSGDEKFPPGLQRPGQTVVEEQQIAGPNQEVITEDDFVVVEATVHALICISPNNVTKGKPGTWTGKNGFLAANCPAASIAAGGTVPSDNAPDI
jgi:hypothetical protein